MVTIPPIPVLSQVVERPEFTLSRDYYIWLETEIRLRLQKTPSVLASDSKTLQSAAIASTTLWSTEQAGLYRFSYYARITTPDLVSNSIQVTLTWTDGGVPQSRTFTALTGITTTTTDDATRAIHCDAGSSIRYSASYASNTPNAMRFRLDVAVEQLS